MKSCFAVSLLILVAVSMPAVGQSETHRVYSALMDPREHPDYERHHVKPPSWETFGNRTQFATLRGFTVENDEIKDYAADLEKYTNTFGLGNVIWPSYPIVFAKNLGDFADEIKKRGLYLFDVWGYVPGSGPGGYWQQYKPPAGALELLEERLGDRWLGMDVGEQDGRYIGGYAGQMYPISADRTEQYLNFQRHFQRMCDKLGNRMSVLVSLNFGHYMLKEGVYSTIGAETAQALPNSQVYYAFIRGAGKQYGVPWFGNASVFNRWGYKTYGSTGPDHGPTRGSSLNLLKRILYNHILYNSVFVGFEQSWFDGAELSPVGKIQRAAQDWVRENGQPGVMQTPVAILLDFFSGWSFPRHLYSGDVYRVWGNVPYDNGDFLTDNLIDVFYPGYQDSSYFFDERGFLAPTPYGDIADCLLSDAPEWLLDRYPVIILGGRISPTAELVDKLDSYVAKGGCIVTTAGNLACARSMSHAADEKVLVKFAAGKAKELGEPGAFSLAALNLPENARVLATCGDVPSAIELRVGAGRVVALASPWGSTDEPQVAPPITGDAEKALAKPWPLLKQVRDALDPVLREQMLFEVGEGLSVITCHKSAGAYTLGICNNALDARPFKIVARCGEIESVKELPLDQSEKTSVGYLPERFETAAIGQSSDDVIAGGDVRIFAVKVREANVTEIAHAVPPARPKGCVLPVRGGRSIQEEILLRPTFFQHFDGVSVDWRYIRSRETTALKEEAQWLALQGVRVWVDLTSGSNLFADLRLVDNDHEEYAASMAVIDEVLEKMTVMDSHDLILSLHRTPENNFSGEQTWASFITTLKDICGKAEAKRITVYLRMSPKGGGSLGEVTRAFAETAAPNLRIAPSMAMFIQQKLKPSDIADLNGKAGLWLASTSMQEQAGGTFWSVNGPLDGNIIPDELHAWLDALPGIPVLFDGAHASLDGEYRDVKALEEVHPQETAR